MFIGMLIPMRIMATSALMDIMLLLLLLLMMMITMAGMLLATSPGLFRSAPKLQ